jgi:hypothetical protein
MNYVQGCVSGLSMPTAEQFFELVLQGLHMPFTSTFDVPELQLTAKLEPELPLRLIVSVTDVSEQEADKRASKFAQELYFRFLLRFGGHIERSEPPRVTGKTFTASGSTSATAIVTAIPPIIARSTVILSQLDVDDLAKDLQLRVITPEMMTMHLTQRGSYDIVKKP